MNILKQSTPAEAYKNIQTVQNFSTHEHSHEITEDKALSFAWAEGLMKQPVQTETGTSNGHTHVVCLSRSPSLTVFIYLFIFLEAIPFVSQRAWACWVSPSGKDSHPEIEQMNRSTPAKSKKTAGVIVLQWSLIHNPIPVRQHYKTSQTSYTERLRAEDGRF